MELAAQTWPDLRSYFETESLALIPVGSTEQHGPHLPEGTDRIIAEALAREAASRAGFLCTPTIDIGVSPHHRQFHGTMWVDAPVFRNYMESLVSNLTYHGIDRVIFVNAHGGNVAHLREVGRRLHDRNEAFAVEWMWDESLPTLVSELFEQNGPHGGPKETAMIQHLAGELVREDRLEEAYENGGRFPSDESHQNGARVFYDCLDNAENGVFGDQRDATTEKGERLFEAATEQLCELCRWLNDQPFEDLVAKSHI
jgi:creatinine amidohydrolase